MTATKTATPKRARPTVAGIRLLEDKIAAQNDVIEQLQAQPEVPTGSAQAAEYEARLKDAQALLTQASTRIKDLEGQLNDALEGKDHSQGEDLPAVEEGRTRFFVDLKAIHADYIRRAAVREGRPAGNMIERIIRIDRSKSTDKAGQVSNLSSMPVADAPRIPIAG